ncbi:MAG: gas vesicle protein [Pseudomonadota bacterium]
MEPQRNTNATLVDLLDRVLDKGLVIHADLIVSVAGIPLIGVNLRAALAGMETMLKYGIMQAWDERIRAWERDYRNKKKSALVQGEEEILKMLGAFYSKEGIYTAWRYGYLYLTDERLFLYHEHFGEVLFEAPLKKIRGLVIREGEHFTDKKVREELYLLLEGEEVCRLTALNVHQLKDALEKRMKEAGLALQDDPEVPFVEGNAAEFLAEGEQVICTGKMWYLMDKEGITDDTWRPGRLYLTDKRVCWYYDLARRVAIEIPVSGIKGSVMETRARNEVASKEKVMDILYASNGTRRVATFSGDALEEWDQIIKRIISAQRVSLAVDETETCPQCGRTASIKELLENGCAGCGWVSPNKKVVSSPLSVVTS